MINIKVGDKWVITSDSLQFILNKTKVAQSGVKKGEVYLEAVGYYPRMSQLVNGLIHFHLREANVNDFKGLEEEIERVAKLCQAAFLNNMGVE